MKNAFGFFGHALRGLRIFIQKERNAKIHLIAAIISISLGLILNIDSSSFLWISLAITIVFTTEILNTAIEKLCDKVEPQNHPLIKDVKDIAAGGVLFTTMFAILVALIIFIPYLIQLFS